jgi:uncharacterized membrane protein required for colicin V production
MGMALDLLVLIVVLASALRGLRQGLVRQLAQLALLIVAWFVAKGAASPLGRTVASALGVSPIVGGAVAFLLVFLAVSIVGHVLLLSQIGKASGEESAGSQLNRALGGAVGASRGLLVSYVVVVMLVQWSRAKGVELPWRSSVSGRFVAEHNALDGGEVGAFSKLAWLAATRTPEGLMAEPALQRLAAREDARALLTPELLRALAAQDAAALASHKPLWTFLQDSAVQAELASIPWVEGRTSGRER